MFKKFMVSLLVIGLVLSLSGTVFGRTKVTFLVTLAMYSTETLNAFEEAFEKTYPDIDLEYEITATAKYRDVVLLRGAIGDLPDVWKGALDARLDKYASASLLMPLDDLIKKEGIDISRYPEFERARRRGKIYAFPCDVPLRGFINYNKEMFNEAGISYPDKNLTWEVLGEMVRKLTVRNEKGNVTRYGMFSKYPMLDFSYAFGGRVIDDANKPTQVLFAQDEFMAGMEEYLRMVEEGSMMPRKIFDALGGSKPKIFGEGKVAMLPTSMGYGGGFKDSPFEWDVASIPLKENGAYHCGGGCLFASSACEYPEAVFEFMNWFVFSEDAMKLIQKNYGMNSHPPYSLDLQEAYQEIAKDRKPDNWRCWFENRKTLITPRLFEGVSDFDSVFLGAAIDVQYGREPLDSLIEAAKECQKLIDQLPWNK